MSTATPTALPRWDLSEFFPGVGSPEFGAAFEAHRGAVGALGERFDRHGVGKAAAPVGDPDVAAFDAVTAALNAVSDTHETLFAFVYAFVSTDSRDAEAQARLSELRLLGVDLGKLVVRYAAWVGALDGDALTKRSETARAHAFPLAMLRVDAAHQMSPEEEALAAELAPSGAGAWARLHEDLTSQITVRLADGGEERERPMSEVRNLAHDGDRHTRRRAYEAELAAWGANAVPLAAAMNGVKGEVAVLSARRGWDSPLAEALHRNRIDPATLGAMLGAAEAAFPDFRRYLRAKARALGLERLTWYDLFAPVGGEAADQERWAYGRATAFIADRFGAYSDRLRAFAERAFAEDWIDAGPRPGKGDGAFCMWVRGGDSRILANYQPSYEGASTLAHELGHAYHNLQEADLTPLGRQTPSTLAETASIFCETIVQHAALAEADEAERFAILEASLQGATQVVVDICSRFRFEERVFARRRERELSVDELNELMLGAQRETYGDGLDPELLHPAMWAVKGHYYSYGSFYNFPYLFGLLFGLGLYARYREDPDGFREGYDDLLAHTGRADAATLAARFGFDLRTPAFWEGSLDVIRADIDRFEGMVGP